MIKAGRARQPPYANAPNAHSQGLPRLLQVCIGTGTSFIGVSSSGAGSQQIAVGPVRWQRGATRHSKLSPESNISNSKHRRKI